ncbi:MAG: signal peptide peptidase SppA [Bdellovibrionaceae bacterium]|nr:signal peptide peptidase SppA [Pseudobdellovibrionaceae bacterium]
MKSFIKQVAASALGMVLGVCAALVIIPAIAALFFKLAQSGIGPIEDKSVLHLDLHGRLVEKARPLDFDFISTSPFSEDERGTGLYELTRALELAKTDSRIQGLYLELDGLETGWASIETLRRAIQDFSKSGKFVYAYAETLDEATYYLATAAERTFMQPNGDLEMNGLSVSTPFLKGLFEKLEMQPRIFRVGKFKAAIEPLILEKMSEENRQQNQTLVMDLWTVIREAFRQPGKLDDTSLDRIASELEVNSARDAFDKGLIHQLAYEDEVLDLLAEKTVGPEEDVRYVTPGQLLRETKAKSGTTSGASSTAKDKIAILFAEGEIVSGSGDRNSIGSRSFVEALDEARSDEHVKAIVVRINSPGGDALAADVIWREISVTNEEIPVVASMGDIAASGGYYMAAGARQIFAEAGTLTGSIGVFGILFDTEDFFRNKMGVNFDRVVSHPYADIGSFNREMTEFEREKIQGQVERVYHRFVQVVRDGRKLPETVDASAFAEGRVWSGLRAKELKLIDEIGGLDAAVRKAAEFAGIADYSLDIYPRDEDPFKRFLELLSGETARALLQGTPLSQLRETVSALPLRSGVYARIPFDLKVR